MNRPPDVELVLRAYLADTGDRAPDRVLEDVGARIARQPRSAWRLRGRPFMNTYAKLGLAAAAVVVVAVVGYSTLPRTGPGPGTAPSPTAPPSAVAVHAYPTAILPAGTNATKNFKPAFTFTVPAGWINDNDTAGGPAALGFYGLFPDTPANRAAYEATGDAANGIVLVSGLERPYFICEAWEDNRGTAAEMAAALAGNEALSTTGLVDVAIGGLTGKQIDVRLSPAWTESCPGDPAGLDLSGLRSRAIFLDDPGHSPLVMFVGTQRAADFDQFMTAAMPVIQSIEFDLGQ